MYINKGKTDMHVFKDILIPSVRWKKLFSWYVIIALIIIATNYDTLSTLIAGLCIITLILIFVINSIFTRALTEIGINFKFFWMFSYFNEGIYIETMTDTYKNASDWCKQNCKSRWTYSKIKHNFFFMSKEDAMVFKLTWM